MPAEVGLLILAAAQAVGIPGAAVFGSFSIFGVSAAAIVGSAVLLGGTIGIQAYLAANQKTPKPQDGQQTVRQPLPVRRRSYGRVKVAGAILFSEAKGGNRSQLFAINQGEVDAFEEHWLDNEIAIVDPGTHAVTNRFTLDGNHLAYIDEYLGTDDDLASGPLISQYPEIWTSAHRGRGIAKTKVLLIQPDSKNYTKVYPGARLPEYRAVIRSAKVWNPDDPDQDKDDKDTWVFSENPVLQILDFHRHKDGMGLAYLDDVLITQEALDEDWIPAAAICDEDIELKEGGTEPRYRCAGNFPLTTPPKDVLTAMLATCDGQTYQRPDGALGVRVGKVISPTVTLNDDHILSYEGMRRGASDSIVPVNQLTAKYTSPDHDYQLTDAQAWRDENEISESGREESRDIDFSWVPSHAQARRLMKLAFARHRPEWSGRIVTNLSGMAAYNERYIRVGLDDFGLDAVFEVGSFAVDPASMTCSIQISSIDPDIFEWDADLEEGTAPPTPDEANEDHIDAPVSLLFSVTGGSGSRKISFSWAASGRPDTTSVAQYSVHGADNWFNAMVTPTTALTPVLAPGDYDIRVYFMVGTREGDITGQPNITVT